MHAASMKLGFVEPTAHDSPHVRKESDPLRLEREAEWQGAPGGLDVVAVRPALVNR